MKITRRLDEAPLLSRSFSKSISIMPLGDFHYGAESCNLAAIKKNIDYIKKNNIKVILLGDLIENATKDSVGSGVYLQKINPMDQISEVIELLRPIQKNIIASVRGNHERRTEKTSGVDPGRIIAMALEIPYHPARTYIHLQVGRAHYSIHAQHGDSGSTTAAGRINAFRRIMEYTNGVDIYFLGHFHHALLQEFPVDYICPRGHLTRRAVYGCVCRAYLDYYTSYAAEKGYVPGVDTSYIFTLGTGPQKEISIDTLQF